MSEAQTRARQADYELKITAEEHAKFRADCLEKAVLLAKAGEADASYRKLLMVVALDGVRAAVTRQKDDAEIEQALAKAKQS